MVFKTFNFFFANSSFKNNGIFCISMTMMHILVTILIAFYIVIMEKFEVAESDSKVQSKDTC